MKIKHYFATERRRIWGLSSWRLLLACLMAIMPVLSPALSSDPDQPVNVEADTADVDEKNGVTIYEGSVVITQGSIRILADKVTVYTGDDGLEKAIAVGKPARMRQRPDNKEEYVRAKALTIEYDALKDLVFLIDKAHVDQGRDQFSGRHIVYNTKENRVKINKPLPKMVAGKKVKPAKGKKERVRITFNPKARKDKDKAKKGK